MKSIYDIEHYNYVLPADAIAQEPAAKRDESRLLVLDCKSDDLSDKKFRDIMELLSPGDLLVTNDTKVFPARLLGRKSSGGRVEFLMLEYPHLEVGKSVGWSEVLVTGLVKSSKKLKVGSALIFSDTLEGVVIKIMADGKTQVRLRYKGEFVSVLDEVGIMPLPPYISREPGGRLADRKRYQTVYASNLGSVAAPTAGLHFTDDLLADIKKNKINIACVTLHVGYGTFAPVRTDDIRSHQIHAEYISVSQKTADLINQTVDAGKAIWAVGTTTVRTLEFAADEQGRVQAKTGSCDLYIYPGYKFKVIRNLITNFHLPKSSLLFMISAMAGRDRILQAYQHAVQHKYRFYSYGDAMAILI